VLRIIRRACTERKKGRRKDTTGLNVRKGPEGREKGESPTSGLTGRITHSAGKDRSTCEGVFYSREGSESPGEGKQGPAAYRREKLREKSRGTHLGVTNKIRGGSKVLEGSSTKGKTVLVQNSLVSGGKAQGGEGGVE